MRGFFQRFNNTVQRFMYGRYGVDEFGSFLLVTGLVLAFLSLFRLFFWLSIPALAILIWSYVRIFSKNFAKRQSELAKYWRIRSRVRDKLAFWKSKMKDKNHRYYRCKLCRTVMRVPRGKGKIEITCPKCRSKIIKKT